MSDTHDGHCTICNHLDCCGVWFGSQLTAAQARVAELEKERDQWQIEHHFRMAQRDDAENEVGIYKEKSAELKRQLHFDSEAMERVCAERDALRARAVEADALTGALILCSRHIGAELPPNCPTCYYTEVAWQVEEHIKALRTRAEKAEGDARWFVQNGNPDCPVNRQCWYERAKPYETP